MATGSNGRPISYRKVRVEDIVIDKEYQRPLDAKRVRGMIDGFDEHLLQPPEVSLRPNGKYACFEGQHRVVMERNRGTVSIFCRVHEGFTEEDEAHYFAKFQIERKGLRPYDRWKAQLRAGEPAQVEINRIVESWGFRVAAGGSSRRGIAAVTALEQIYSRGGAPHLDDVLGFLAGLWDGEEALTNHPMLLGTAAFLMAFGDKVGDVQMRRLRKHAPVVILRRAVSHGTPQTASSEGVAKELRALAQMKRVFPVRYTKTFGAPPRRSKAASAKRPAKKTPA